MDACGQSALIDQVNTMNEGGLMPDSDKHVVIRASEIYKSYSTKRGEEVLKGVDLEVRRGDLVVIRGDNGSGKSTLLRILGLIDRRFDKGHIEINGDLVSGFSRKEAENFRAKNIGFVFQDEVLFPKLSLRENSELPARLCNRWPDPVIRAWFDELQDFIFGRRKEERQVVYRIGSQVSGGQRRRAAILRSLAHRPGIILADEPTANLDPDAASRVVRIFKYLCLYKDMTVIVVSHDKIFDEGVIYNLSNGLLEEKEEIPIEDTASYLDVGGQVCLSALPFAKMARLVSLLKIAQREILKPSFAAMVIFAMFAGIFLATVIWHVLAGSDEVLEEIVSNNSRLDRISVKVNRDGDLPTSDEINGLGSPVRAVTRRDIPIHIDRMDRMDRMDAFDDEPIIESVFGLEIDDPEMEKLGLQEGRPFADEHALAVLMTQSSVQRIFGGGVTQDQAVKRKIQVQLHRYYGLGGEEDPQVRRLEFHVQGIVRHEEAHYSLYLPQGTLRSIGTWQRDRRLKTQLTNVGGRLQISGMEGEEPFPWERLDVYCNSIYEVLPAKEYFTRRGFETDAELFGYRWVVHTQEVLEKLFWGIVIMVLVIIGLQIVGNVTCGINLNRRQIALLKLMGMRDRDVVLIFVVSVLVCALIGGLLGLVAGGEAVDEIQARLLEDYPDFPLAQVMGQGSWFWCGVILLGCLSVNAIVTALSAWLKTRRDTLWTIE